MVTNEPKLPALPIELWLEIVSYLPRNSRRKAIGINRFFFELVLDEIYEELRIVTDDQETSYRFSQLHNKAIATRVQRLFISSEFLCGLEGHHDAVVQTTVQQRFRSFLATMNTTGTAAVTSHDAVKGALLLETAEKNITMCSNIRELEVVLLRGRALTPPFKSLLKSLWRPESIAPRLNRLTIDSMPAKLAELMEVSLYKLSNFMTSLQHFNITFSVDDDVRPTSKANFKPFFAVLQHKLNSLSTSDLLGTPHLFDLYKNAPTFTTLRKLEICIASNVLDSSPFNQVSQFIVQHADTLEHLVFKPRSYNPGIRGSTNLMFREWLTGHAAAHGSQRFSSLLLPHLRIMEFSLCDVWVNINIQTPSVFPDFVRVTPALRELTITDAEIPLSRLCELINCLPTSNGQCTLELLNVHTQVLSPEHMDLFAEKLPRLKCLELHLSVATEDMEHFSPHQLVFCDIIRTRSYPTWNLKYLRITSLSFCGTPHPNSVIMKAVAATLSAHSNVKLATSYRCDCDLRPNLNHFRSSRNFGDCFE